MSTATKNTLSNRIARQYFLHDCDTHEDGQRCCFFAEGTGESGWGFWVRADGTVDIDDVSSNGKLPPRGIIAPCVRAAVRHLRTN